MLKRILPLLILIMAIPTMVMAQITTSSMTGSIKNATDEPLVGATITAIHQPTGTKYVTTSRSGGTFTINNMRVGGPYTVEISFVGFVTDKQEDLYLKLAEPFLLNTSLKSSSGELTNVVVTTSARRNPILNANRNGAVTNLSRVQIERLPTISRSVNDLTRATPQAGNSGTFGGGNYRQNNFTIDGADFNNSFGIGGNLPANGAPISVDALEEISVNITPYDIRQSGFIGSAINAVTRSGTNNFSGSVYKYFRTEKQRGDKVSSTKFVRPAEEFDMFGVRVGGPIIKNKLFFFLNYEKEEQPKSIQTRFAATPSLPYGPANPNVAKPTAAELDNISQYLLNTYGYVTGPYDNYTTVIERKKIMARLDWNISQKHKLNLRYSQVEGGEPNPPSTSRSPLTAYATSLGRTTENALWFKNSNYFQGANFYSFAAELNSSFKRVSNTFRATYTFQNDSRTTESQIFPFVDILDGTVAATDVSQTGVPFASFGHEPFSFGNLRKVKMYSLVDNLTWTSGKHNWTVGIQADLSQTINGFQRFATSYYTFASWNDFITGQKPKDFAITYSLAPGYAQSFPSFKFAQYSLYGQDEIVASKNLRLTFGLRLDQPGYPDVDEVKTHPLVASLTFANGEKINTGVLPKKRLMWSPRFGFNWDFYGDRSMQFRGGTGIFTGRIPFVWIVSQSGDAQMLQATRTFIGQANTPGPFNPDPAAYRPATVPAAGTFIGNPISALDPDFKIPQTWKTSLAMDVKLFGGIVATIEAIYNKDLNTAVFRNPNLVNPSPLNVTGYPDNRMIYPNSNTQKFINPLTSAGLPSSTGTAALNTIVMDNGSKGYYFSLTAQLQKQFRGGFFASVAYTKSMADNLFDGNGDQPLSAWQGTANVNGSNFASLGYAGFVIPDRVIANFSYRKEYFKHLGTTISLFYEGGIGGRFSYVYSADFNRDGTNLDLIYIPTSAQVQQMRFANLTVNGTTYDQAAQRNLFENYILQDKYLSKHRGQYAERNGAQIPWRNQVDVRLLQDVFTNIGKNKNTLQFSIDVFNFGNLLNPSWGKQKTINASAILVPTNVASLTPGGATVPEFRLATANGAVVTNTFRDNVSVFSTYYMQFGLRYIFGN